VWFHNGAFKFAFAAGGGGDITTLFGDIDDKADTPLQAAVGVFY